MALGSLLANLTASGIGFLSDSINRKKLEKKINSGIVEYEDLTWLCNFYFIKKDYFKAEAYAKKANELKPDKDGPKNLLFNIYFATKDYKKAIEILESLIHDGSDLSIHYFNLGYCYYEMGNLDKAEECKNKAAEYDPKKKGKKYR